jgi:hypothetical protein
MKGRCYSSSYDTPRTRTLKNYKQRGIVVCPEWKYNYEAFREWALTSGYKVGLWLDRRDGNKNYSPENCRWVTPTESARNTNAVRLKPRDVFVIRMAASRGIKPPELAKKYGVSERHIRDIAAGRSWQGTKIENNA